MNVVAPVARTRLTERLPLFRGIDDDALLPEHVAPAAAYLLSDAAREVTGQVVGIAGDRVYAFVTEETPGCFSARDGFGYDELCALDGRWFDLSGRRGR